MKLPGTPSHAAARHPIAAGLFGVCCLLVSCLLIASATAAGSGKQQKAPLDERARAAGEAFVKDMKSIGRDFKNSEIARAFKQLGREVRQVTRAAWEETLEARKQVLRELREKNKELKRQLEQKRKSREKES